MINVEASCRIVALHQASDGRWRYALRRRDGQVIVGCLDRRFVPDRTDPELARRTVWPWLRSITGRLAAPHEAGLELVLVVDKAEDDQAPLRACIGDRLFEEPAWDSMGSWEFPRARVLAHLGLPDSQMEGQAIPARAVQCVRKLAGLDLAADQVDEAWATGLLSCYLAEVIDEPLRVSNPRSAPERARRRVSPECETASASTGVHLNGPPLAGGENGEALTSRRLRGTRESRRWAGRKLTSAACKSGGAQEQTLPPTPAEQPERPGSGDGPEEQLITREMLQQMIPVTSMTLWRWRRAGIFPQPVVFNGRTYWRQSEVRAWIAARRTSGNTP